MIRNSESQYGIIAKGFHWLLFLMLTFSVIAGNFLASMPKGVEKLQAAGMHKSFGLIILSLILMRLAWRLINTTPKHPDGTTPAKAALANAMHWGLYALMLAQPIAGILMSQAFGYPASLFGIVDFPTLIEKNIELAKLFKAAHGYIWIVLVIAVAGHVGAALYHHFIEKNDVLNRMGFKTKE
ncbi:cytochrome b [Mariprofundus sp. NF]|uniref:cytochrome b n=1 Tax=Mariprofundus sp. NF TaxID=2608716 RepID=UPI0015A17D5A|nr:cytochrome b [Mariprofundus sp. NF]